MCTTLIDRGGSGHATELVEEAGTITPRELAAIFKALMGLLARAKTLVLSGSLAPGLAANFYADCCRAANAAGAAVIVDARGRELMLALRARPMVAKCNRAELAATVGKPIEDETALRKAMTLLHRRGAQWVIVTLGAAGARAHDGRSFWTIPAARIEAVSAIGSGDAFAAGVAAGIARGQNVAESCRLGAACAAANTLIPGSGLLRLADVRRLLKQTRVIRCRCL
jgi:tagatose 6-phosphate kinase